MGFASKLKGRAAGLVWPVLPASPFERTRQESFVLRQLVNSAAAAAIAFFCFALQEPFAFADAAVLSWLIVPLNIVTLSATGKASAAEAVTPLSYMAAGLTAGLGGGILSPTAFLWFAIASAESSFSANGALASAMCVSSALTALLLAAATGASHAFPAPTAAPYLVPAIAGGVALATGFARQRVLRRAARRAPDESINGLAESLACLAVCCDAAGSLSAVSANCEALLGVAPSALMGHGFFERVQVADRPAFLKAISDASAGVATATARVRWRGSARRGADAHGAPVYLWLEMRAGCSGRYRLGQGAGDKDKVVALFRDASEAKPGESLFEKAHAASGEANAAMEILLARAGHELRAPLTAIAGFSELLANPRLVPPDPEKQREYARIINESGHHLLAVVNSILDISTIQSGSLAIKLEHFAAAPQIDLCCDMVRLQAENGGIGLLRAYPPNLEEINGDKRLFTQIFVNLLSNAVKFTPAGGRVTVSARPEASSLQIQVSDTGIGIAACDLAKLGNPFFQANALPEHWGKGAGLGLSIVRGLVGLLGGAIAIASEAGKGTCIQVRLPLDCRDLAARPGAPAKIETAARLPGQGRDALFSHMMGKKIA